MDKKNWSDTYVHIHTKLIIVPPHFYNWLKHLNSAKFGGDEENVSCSQGSNVYSQ